MTMVPAENLSNHHHHHHHSHRNQSTGYYNGYCYGGGRGSYSDSVGLMSRMQQNQPGGCDNYTTTTTTSSADHNAFLSLGSDHNNLGDAAADHPMAEDESRTNSLNTDATEAEAEAEAGSSSKDHNIINREEGDDGGWLQLSIGSHTERSNGGGLIKQNHGHDDQLHPTPARRGEGLLELDLLPASSLSLMGAASATAPSFHHESAADHQFIRGQRAPVLSMAAAYSTPLLFHRQQEGSSSSASLHPHHYHNHEINWGFRPPPTHQPQNLAMASPSTSSLTPFGSSYFARPLLIHHQQQQRQQHVTMHTPGFEVSAATSSDFRISDPPRRPHSGIWFMLLASKIQPKEPFLPQIPKSYLRIKDGRMTVRLLMKYLVKKLKLDTDSEVEITCRGQQLQPCLTLQHVRDQIWSPTPTDAVASTSSTTDHLMLLHYARSTSSPVPASASPSAASN